MPTNLTDLGYTITLSKQTGDSGNSDRKHARSPGPERIPTSIGSAEFSSSPRCRRSVGEEQPLILGTRPDDAEAPLVVGLPGDTADQRPGVAFLSQREHVRGGGGMPRGGGGGFSRSRAVSSPRPAQRPAMAGAISIAVWWPRSSRRPALCPDRKPIRRSPAGRATREPAHAQIGPPVLR